MSTPCETVGNHTFCTEGDCDCICHRAAVVHLEPVRIGGKTLCCQRTISQLSVWDKVTRNGKELTCDGRR